MNMHACRVVVFRWGSVLGLLMGAACDTGMSDSQTGSKPSTQPARQEPAQGPRGFDDTLFGGLSGNTIAGQLLSSTGQPVDDAVVYIDSGLPDRKFAVLERHAVIDQKGKTFVPHVLPVLIGTAVDLPNQDDVLHNVYSHSSAKAFDLGMYPKPEVKTVVFDTPGKVDLFCAVHTQMHAIIFVLENPYYSVSDKRGYFEIRDVPEGSYRLKVWHELHGDQDVPVQVRSDRLSPLKLRFLSDK